MVLGAKLEHFKVEVSWLLTAVIFEKKVTGVVVMTVLVTPVLIFSFGCADRCFKDCDRLFT